MKAVLCVVLGILCCGPTWAQETVKIGFMYVLSGRGAVFGTVSQQGAQLALEELNAGGGVLGRKLVGVFEDEKTPDQAVKIFTRLVNEEKVDAVIGIISSAVAASVVPIANALRTPFILTTAQTPMATGRDCNHYTFRVTWSNDQALKTAAIVAADLKAKTWTTIGPDYALGYEAWDLFQKYMRDLNSPSSFLPTSEVIFAPLDTTDWKTRIAALEDSKADGVLVSLWGGNLIDFMRQARWAGFFGGKRTVLCVVPSEGELVALGNDAPEGFWVVAPYWSRAISNPANKVFAGTYEERYGSPPSYQAHFAYAGVKVYAEAIRRAGTTDKEAVVKALEGMALQLPVGPLTIRPEDHQALFDSIAGRISPRFELTKLRRPFRGLDSVKRIPAAQITLPIEQTGCKMR